MSKMTNDSLAQDAL